MTTTFQKFTHNNVGNYSTRPSIDVDILDEARVCETCDKVVVWDSKGGEFGWGGWVHEDGSNDHPARAVPQCRFCGGQGTVSYRQEAWYDATDCSRCGGVSGYAIGD
jgi:hypothetical protein